MSLVVVRHQLILYVSLVYIVTLSVSHIQCVFCSFILHHLASLVWFVHINYIFCPKILFLLLHTHTYTQIHKHKIMRTPRTAMGCIVPSAPQNGRLVLQTEDTLKFQCDPSFVFPDTIQGSRTLFCTDRNIWDTSLPDCVGMFSDYHTSQECVLSFNKILYGASLCRLCYCWYLHCRLQFYCTWFSKQIFCSVCLFVWFLSWFA